MTASRLYRVDAIVLKRHDFGEADRVVTLYTREYGKINAVAKAVRRPTSRLAGPLELFTHAQIQLARGRNLDVITQTASVERFAAMRDDLWRTTYACQAAELVDRLSPERVENRPLWDLLRDTLARLNGTDDPEVGSRAFEIKALELLGYRPELRQCVNCRQDLGPTSNFFSPVAGGVLCLACGRVDVTARALTTNAFKVLRLLQTGDYATLLRVRLDADLRRELEAITRGHIAYILERELKSTAVLGHLKSLLRVDEPPEPVAGSA